MVPELYKDLIDIFNIKKADRLCIYHYEDDVIKLKE